MEKEQDPHLFDMFEVKKVHEGSVANTFGSLVVSTSGAVLGKEKAANGQKACQ